MVMTDPIADMLTRIRNAVSVGRASVDMPSSKLKVSVAEVLLREGYIEGFKIVERPVQNELHIRLKYGPRGERIITSIQRVSKPGLRVYVKKGEIPRPYGGLGVTVLSTSKGVMTGRKAWREGIGGELLCYVW